MNIAQLEYFLAACRTLNYTRAAEQCFTSRQNLTHSIRDLEKELGATLLIAGKGSLSLTVEGVEAARRARKILDEVQSLKSAFSPTQDTPDPLNVVVGLNLISCTSYDVSTALESYDDKVRLGEYGCKTCYERIVDGSDDVAIVGCMERLFPQCDSVVFSSSKLYLLVNGESELARKQQLEITDLAGHRIAILPDYEFQFEPFIDSCKAHGISTGNIDVISNVGLMLHAVRKADSIGIASASFRDNPPNGTLAVPLADPAMRMNLYVLSSPTQDKTAKVSRFIAFITRELHAME